MPAGLERLIEHANLPTRGLDALHPFVVEKREEVAGYLRTPVPVMRCRECQAQRCFIGGDICPIGNGLAALLESDPGHAFGEMVSYEADADLAVANLECPLFDGHSPIRKSGPTLKAPVCVASRIRKAGFGLLTLANNHLRDHGSDGVQSAIAACRNAAIETVGAGEHLEEAQQVKIVELAGMKLGFIGACEGVLPGDT